MNKTRKIEISVEIIRILSAIAISYGIALLTLIVISSDPLFIVRQFVLGPLTSLRRIGSIISLAVPFTFTGLCFCFMYAVNKFNLAGEGIFMLSGCIATWVALTLGNTLSPFATILGFKIQCEYCRGFFDAEQCFGVLHDMGFKVSD